MIYIYINEGRNKQVQVRNSTWHVDKTKYDYEKYMNMKCEYEKYEMNMNMKNIIISKYNKKWKKKNIKC